MLSWLKKPERYFLLCARAVKLSQYTKLEMTLIHLSFGILPGIRPLIFHLGGGGGEIWNVPFYISHLKFSHTVVHMRSRCFYSHSLSFAHTINTNMQNHVLTQTNHGHTYSMLITTTCADTNGRQRFIQYHFLNQTAHKWTLVLISKSESVLHFRYCATLF